MDIVFQDMDLISNGEKTSFFVDASLKKLHKISDEACQLFLQNRLVFNRIQRIIHKMRCDLILQRFQFRIFFLLFLLNHLGDQIFDVIQHMVEFFSQGSDLIGSGHFCAKA